MLAELRPRQMPDRLVHRHQDAVFLDGQPQQECVRDLLMTVDPVLKWLDERGPTGLDGPEAVAGIITEAFQHIGRLFKSTVAGRCIRRNAKKACFGKCAQAPLQARGAEPSRHHTMMNVPRIEQSDQNVYIEQMSRRTQSSYSSSAAFTISLVITLPSVRGANISIPLGPRMRPGDWDLSRTRASWPLRTNSLMAAPNVIPLPLAQSIASSYASSSSVTVVLMKHIMHQSRQ